MVIGNDGRQSLYEEEHVYGPFDESLETFEARTDNQDCRSYS